MKEFRIKQRADKLFSIQRLYKKRVGYFWQKKKEVKVWEYVSLKMTKPYLIEVNSWANFKSLEDAKKYISDYKKFPIYH